MAFPIVPNTLDQGDVDINTNPPTVPLFQTQQVNYNQTVGGNLVSFGQLDPEPPPEIGTTDFVSGKTTLYDPGTGVAEGTTSFYGGPDAPFAPTGATTEAADGVTSYFGESEPFVPIGVPVEGGTGKLTTFSDDNTAPNTQTAQTDTNKTQQSDRIEPQPNVLARFSSFAYVASVYLLTPAQLEVIQQQKKKNLNGYNLLFQSGGAPVNTQGPQGGQGTRTQQTSTNGAISGGTRGNDTISPDGRNPFFAEDFYIDSITIENRLFGRATGASHSAAELKFTVIEPLNITLIDRLYKAVQDSAPKDAAGKVNYAAACYLMVLRFYGYDANGNIQPVGAADSKTGLTDPNAVVEKFIPFKIKEIRWSIGDRLVQYEFDCAPIGQMVAGGTRRGTIPADVELSGSTVRNMLLGNVKYSTAQAPSDAPGSSTTPASQQTPPARGTSGQPVSAPPAPGKADAAPSPKQTLRQGLIEAMNSIQAQYQREGKIQVPDVYELEFGQGAESIADATVTKPGKKTNKAATANPRGTQDTQVNSPDKQNMDVTTRNYGITAGMQLLQAIELIIRNSNYITNQAALVRDETTGQLTPNPRSKTKGVKWFNILMTVSQLQYDELRNDYAYKIKYTIVPYELVDFNSFYFPQTQFRGVHKRYPWWFTGLNTEVLNYNASFNKLFNITVTAGSLDGNALQEVRKRFTSNGREIAFLQVQARSSESDKGAEGGANELAASAAEYLYSPSDNANVQLRILGDPAWIQQGSMSGLDINNIGLNPFEPDGTINFDVNDVLFEVVWQRPEDYDTLTGLADPYSRTSKTFGNRDPIQSVIYRAATVTSSFNRGRFETTVNGTLYQYPVPESASNTGSSLGVTGDAEAQAAAQRRADEIERTGGSATTTGRSPNLTGGAVPEVAGTSVQQAVQASQGGNNNLALAPTTAQPLVGVDSGEFDTLVSDEYVGDIIPNIDPTSNGGIVPEPTDFTNSSFLPAGTRTVTNADGSVTTFTPDGGVSTFFGEPQVSPGTTLPQEGRLKPQQDFYARVSSPQKISREA